MEREAGSPAGLILDPMLVRLLMKDCSTGSPIITEKEQTPSRTFFIQPEYARSYWRTIIHPDFEADETDFVRLNEKLQAYDQAWFSMPHPFNKPAENGWQPTSRRLPFNRYDDWKDYVQSQVLLEECRHAYAAATPNNPSSGKPMAVIYRIGILDRKLRALNENTQDEGEWLVWAERTLKSMYGYELDGSLLFEARRNLLQTMADHFMDRFHHPLSREWLEKFASIISWNFFQMDSRGWHALSRPAQTFEQISLFDEESEKKEKEEADESEENCPCRQKERSPYVKCKVQLWRWHAIRRFCDLLKCA